jgi:hypothetical protein
MPLFLAPIIAILLGTVFADACSMRMPLRYLTKARAFVLAFTVLCFVPPCAYFTFVAPGWSTAYVVDEARIPSALLLLGVIGSAALVAVTFELSRRRLSPTAGFRPSVLTLGAAVAAVALTIALYDRLGWVGTKRGLVTGRDIVPLSSSPLFAALLGLDGLLLVGATLTRAALRSLGHGSPGAGERLH